MAARKQRNVAAEIRIGRPKPCKLRKTAGKPRASHDQRKNAVALATAMIPSTPMVHGKALAAGDPPELREPDLQRGARQRRTGRDQVERVKSAWPHVGHHDVDAAEP